MWIHHFTPESIQSSNLWKSYGLYVRAFRRDYYIGIYDHFKVKIVKNRMTKNKNFSKTSQILLFNWEI